MDYLGEWMWAALLGRTLVAVAFASALLATVAFVRGNVKLGRTAFFTHAVSTLGVIALMFVLFFGHRYEFQYIWKHLNNEMPMRFRAECVLGWTGRRISAVDVLAQRARTVHPRRADHWQREVMAVLSGIEAFPRRHVAGHLLRRFPTGTRSLHAACARRPTTLGSSMDCARRLPYFVSSVC